MGTMGGFMKGGALNKILTGTTCQSIRILMTKKLFGDVVINHD